MMQIQVNPGDATVTDELEHTVHEEVKKATAHFAQRVTRIEAHLRDLNGPKSGLDKRCTIEVRLAGLDPIAVEHDATDMYEAIRGAAGKMQRAVEHLLDRHRERVGKNHP